MTMFRSYQRCRNTAQYFQDYCQTCCKKFLMNVKSSFPKGVLRQQYCAQWSVAEIQWLRQRPGTSLCQCFCSPVRRVEDNIELKKP